MLDLVILILILAWLGGWLGLGGFGGLIHFLIVVAVVCIIFRLAAGRTPPV
jgi:hypothetical protein